MRTDPSEALYFDAEPVAHIVTYRERARIATIEARGREALARVTGSRFRGPVVSFA